MEKKPYPKNIGFPESIPAGELKAGNEWILPAVRLSESEIIEFAHRFDPQKVHIDVEFARNSQFGGIIASGLQPYITLHTRYWVSMNEKHFVCGLSFDGARFFAPVYPNRPFWGLLAISGAEPKPNKKRVVVKWELEIYDVNDEILLQRDNFSTYHSLSDEF